MFNKLRFSGLVLLVLISVLFTGCFGFLSPKPQYTVEGVEHEKTYNGPVTPKVTADDDKTEITLLLNDKPFESGTTITSDGEYTLTIKAKAGKKETTETIKFSIDTGAPSITITDVEDGGYYSDVVTPKITIGENDNRDGIEVTITLNGEEYEEGTTIEEHGEYTLTVTAKKGDKQRVVTIKFEIGKPLAHQIGIYDGLQGFQGDATTIEYNTDPKYIKSGDGSLKATTDSSGKGVRINRHSDHPDWITDWTPYDKLTAWVYIEDISQLNENAFTFRVYVDPQKNHGWSASELENGWNLLEVDLKSLLDEEILKDMSNIFVELIIRASGETVTVYIDEILLVKNK